VDGYKKGVLRMYIMPEGGGFIVGQDVIFPFAGTLPRVWNAKFSLPMKDGGRAGEKYYAFAVLQEINVANQNDTRLYAAPVVTLTMES
jgi:hypothetical protein